MHWPAGWAETESAVLAAAQAPWPLFPARLYRRLPMLAVAGRDADGPLRAGQSRYPDRFCGPACPHKDRQPNIASLLKEHAGYEVVWKGKWHLSYASNAAIGNGGEDWGPADIEVMEKNWGWSGWNPPDAGNSPSRNAQGTPFGVLQRDCARSAARNPNNDGRYVSGPQSVRPRSDARGRRRKCRRVPEEAAKARPTVLHVHVAGQSA